MLNKIKYYLNALKHLSETQTQIRASIETLSKAQSLVADRVLDSQTQILKNQTQALAALSQLVSNQKQAMDSLAQIVTNQTQGLANHRDLMGSTNRILAANGDLESRVADSLQQVFRNQQMIAESINRVAVGGETPDHTLNQAIRQVLEKQDQILNAPGKQDQILNAPGKEAIFDLHGTLVSTADYSDNARQDIALYHPYRARAECALDVCSMYSQGDYFEFGSDGMGTFRNFLSAFHLFDLPTTLPDTRFYAFDIFGKVEEEKDLSEFSKKYFDSWKDVGHDKLQEAHDHVASHNIMPGSCHIVPGYFEDTLTDERKQSYLTENRSIAFAFVDCNITTSYELVFDFIFELMAKTSFIYMDEYFINADVPGLYKKFSDLLRDERGIESHYMRNAGAFGALFRLLPQGKFDTP